VVGPTSHLYFDHYQSEDREREPLAWGGCSPLEKVYGFEPVMDGLDEKAASHILGVQGQVWTEYIPDLKYAEYMAFPRACALAEIAWSPENKKDYGLFLERMKLQEQRFDAAGINHRHINP
jgi:hexosaminidase